MANENNNQNNAVSDIELLTCSARDYAENQRRNLSSYRLIGVSTEMDRPEGKASNEWYYNKPDEALKNIARKRGCVVVVDLRQTFDTSFNKPRYAGTGMILENDKKEKEE
jgi:hypothetical protein